MKSYTQENLQNPDKLLADPVRYGRYEIVILGPQKIDKIMKDMKHRLERLGDTASYYFVPKDYTKPKYEALASEPTPKKVDPYEQAIAEVAKSSKNIVDPIDTDLARMLVEQSLQGADYVAKGIDDLENLANNQEKSNVR